MVQKHSMKMGWYKWCKDTARRWDGAKKQHEDGMVYKWCKDTA